MKHFAAVTGWEEDKQRRPGATYMIMVCLLAPEPLLHLYVQVSLFPASVQAPKVKSSASFALGVHDVQSHNKFKEGNRRIPHWMIGEMQKPTVPEDVYFMSD